MQLPNKVVLLIAYTALQEKKLHVCPQYTVHFTMHTVNLTKRFYDVGTCSPLGLIHTMQF